ncbi:hypothetical protein HNQ91_005859 [Filimonas zeae]|uniref:Uncharacterized protein n=1 Tax=Filimonas zeae TaxID=1737353 RepID=A0A917J4I1_9BACT|nr:hypothetical protein [Filimonas zeae]MDR6342772.1 hypothetical protein [Filimonas zeae]GGH82646.1 hypothetical protein GCM10011379_56840 [Filimonas zeae]
MNTAERIKKYLNLRESLRHELSLIDINKPDDGLEGALRELLKDVAFEGKVFELMLQLNPEVAADHLRMYYLDDDPYTKARFKGNLDIMLDDYKVILGEDAFAKLVSSLPEETVNHPVVKEAIEFANDD